MNRDFSQPVEPDSPSKDFMLAQHRALADSFWRNEEQGERRVNFLIGLVTAVIAALVALAEAKDQNLADLLLPAIIALTALLLLGIVTWRRMLARNRATDEYKRGMEIVRAWFESDDPGLEAHRPFPKVLLALQDYADFALVLDEATEPGPLEDGFEKKFKPAKIRFGNDARIRPIEQGQRWLVSGMKDDGWWRSRQHILHRTGDKLAVYKPRTSNWGGLAEWVGVMNSLFVGVLLVLAVLFVDAQWPGKLAPLSIGGSPLLFAVLLGLVGLIGALITQHQLMIEYYQGCELHLPEAEPAAAGRADPAPQEHEIALRFASTQPEEIAARIAGLHSISYQLVPRESLEIHDIYFDTESKALEPQKLALRIREAGTQTWLTFKGPSKTTERTGVVRPEIEEPWSRGALEQVVQALAGYGIEITAGWRFSDGHPRQVLEAMGFRVIQDRRTHRQVRDIVAASQAGGPALAELAIDEVTFHLGDRPVRHFEVEIESKSPRGTDLLAPLTAALKAELGDVLQRWDHPKLAVGLALDKLWEHGEPEALLDPAGHLAPEAYARLDEYLQSSDG